jgi:ribosomal protein S4
MKRLDTALFEKSMARSRTNAQQIIEKGFVRVNNRVILKPYILLILERYIRIYYHEKYVAGEHISSYRHIDVF